MGCGWEAVVSGLESTPTAPRIRVLRPADDFVLIDDTYNASPASCLAALELLAESPGTRVAVLGDMLELGDFGAEAHTTVGAHVPDSADALIAVGPESRATANAATAHGLNPFNVMWVPRAADASDAFDTWRRASGVVGPLSVLVKGSRGMRMELATRDLERRAATTRSAATRRTGERS
jgi:UDP-N-acetylmuramoyl-tripeptide--D-alanyl-D-alanine ligase